jgi:hypothetical protein
LCPPSGVEKHGLTLALQAISNRNTPPRVASGVAISVWRRSGGTSAKIGSLPFIVSSAK